MYMKYMKLFAGTQPDERDSDSDADSELAHELFNDYLRGVTKLHWRFWDFPQKVVRASSASNSTLLQSVCNTP